MVAVVDKSVTSDIQKPKLIGKYIIRKNIFSGTTFTKGEKRTFLKCGNVTILFNWIGAYQDISIFCELGFTNFNLKEIIILQLNPHKRRTRCPSSPLFTNSIIYTDIYNNSTNISLHYSIITYIIHINIYKMYIQ